MIKTAYCIILLSGFAAFSAQADPSTPTISLNTSIEEGTHLGMTKAGILCVPSGVMSWGRKPYKINLAQIANANSDNLKIFSSMVPEGFVIKSIEGEIFKAETHLCFKNAYFRDFSTLKGDLSVKVRWTLTDADGKILRVEKENFHHIEKFKDSDLNTEFALAIFGQN